MHALCLSLPFHCIPAVSGPVNMGLIKRTRKGRYTPFWTALAPQMTATRNPSSRVSTAERWQTHWRGVCIFRHKWAIWKAIVCSVGYCTFVMFHAQKPLREMQLCLKRACFFYACCCCCCFLWVLCRPLKWLRSHAHACTCTHRCTHPFFSISLSADSNESSVHLCLFCAERLRLKSFSADWGAIHVQNSSHLSRQRRAAEFMEICVDLKYLTVMSVCG